MSKMRLYSNGWSWLSILLALYQLWQIMTHHDHSSRLFVFAILNGCDLFQRIYVTWSGETEVAKRTRKFVWSLWRPINVVKARAHTHVHTRSHIRTPHSHTIQWKPFFPSCLAVSYSYCSIYSYSNEISAKQTCVTHSVTSVTVKLYSTTQQVLSC